MVVAGLGVGASLVQRRREDVFAAGGGVIAGLIGNFVETS